MLQTQTNMYSGRFLSGPKAQPPYKSTFRSQGSQGTTSLKLQIYYQVSRHKLRYCDLQADLHQCLPQVFGALLKKPGGQSLDDVEHRSFRAGASTLLGCCPGRPAHICYTDRHTHTCTQAWAPWCKRSTQINHPGRPKEFCMYSLQGVLKGLHAHYNVCAHCVL